MRREMLHLCTALDIGANSTCNESLALVTWGGALRLCTVHLHSSSSTSILAWFVSATANLSTCTSQFPNLGREVILVEVNPHPLPASLALIWAAYGALCKVVVC
jgi:hypothetical protein